MPDLPRQSDTRRRSFVRLSVRALLILVLIAGCATWWVLRRGRLRAALADYRQTQMTREVAEVSVVEYVEGVYPNELEAAQGQIKLAESKAESAEEYLQALKQEKGQHSNSELFAAMLARRSAERAVEEARKKVPSVEQARDKAVQELKANLEKAKADERAKKAAYDREKAAGLGLVW